LKRRSAAGIIGIGLLFGPVIINSSLIVPVGTELAERLLYPASVAASAIVAFVVYRAADFRFRRVVIVLLILLFSVQSWSAQRPWRNQLDLYARGVEAEPLSARLHLNHGMNFLYSGDGPAAAWHFMVMTYIKANFPNRVDPMPIIQLEQLPVEQKIAEGPAKFAPEDPCRFLGSYFQFMQATTPHLTPYVRKFLSGRYPECASSLSSQTLPAKPGSMYELTDGTKLQSPRFSIHELETGAVKVTQAPASIGSANGPLLPGQSFLGGPESWSPDNKRQVLIIGPGAAQPK
jgi:hypothetical protein